MEEQDRLDEMVADFVKRSKTRYTVEQIKDTMAKCPTLVVEDGFLVLDIYLDECHVLYMYVKPGADVLPLFEFVTEDVARYFNCRVIRFISRREEKSIMRRRPDYKPCAIMYEKELSY